MHGFQRIEIGVLQADRHPFLTQIDQQNDPEDEREQWYPEVIIGQNGFPHNRSMFPGFSLKDDFRALQHRYRT
jgi:hypothetical protein